MKTIIISGARSHVGKTALARFIRGILPESVRVKIGHHAPKSSSDDGFYYEMGVNFADISRDHAGARFLVIESNAMLSQISPDCCIYLSADNPKPSAAAARKKADIIRGELVNEADVRRIAARLEIDKLLVRKIAWFAGARPQSVIGIILAGGKSSRMGTDKALLELGGRPLALNCRDAIAPYCDEVIFSVNTSNADKFIGYKTVVDDIAGEGPLRGIESGLSASPADVNLVVACDIPYIDPFVLFTLLSHCDEYDIVVPSFAPGTQEPLYGIYRKAVGPVAQEMLSNGQRRVSGLFGRCRTKIVSIDDRGRYANLNTRADLEIYTNNLIPRPLLNRGEGESNDTETCSSRRNRTSGVTALQYVDDKKKRQARLFRKNATPAEEKLWSCLRNRKTGGLKFRRQQVIDGFIADFYCEESRLVIEVDGNVHDTRKQKAIDIHREKVFTERGIITLRFRNEDIINNINKCLKQIVTVSQDRINTMDFLPRSGQ